MDKPKATTETNPAAEPDSRDARRESLFGRLRANMGVKAMIGAAVLSTSLWLAGCGNSGTASSASEDPGAQEAPGIEEAPAFDPELLETAEGREEVFETQGTAMALGVATALGNYDGTKKGTIDNLPNVYAFHTDPAFVFSDETKYFTEANITNVDDLMTPQQYTTTQQYEGGVSSSGTAELGFYAVGVTPDSESKVGVSVSLTVPEYIVEQSPTPQSLRENLERNEDAVMVRTIGFDGGWGFEEDDTQTLIYLEDGKLVMEKGSLTTSGYQDDGDELVGRAEPFGEVMSSADKALTDLLAQLQQ